jgi:predicted nucleic acid-binding protein
VVTIGELYAGMRPHERVRTEELLSGFEEFEVTTEIARYAGLLKNEWASKGFTLTLSDTMIAATAIANNLVLVTENGKDFPMEQLALFKC